MSNTVFCSTYNFLSTTLISSVPLAANRCHTEFIYLYTSFLYCNFWKSVTYIIYSGYYKCCTIHLMSIPMHTKRHVSPCIVHQNKHWSSLPDVLAQIHVPLTRFKLKFYVNARMCNYNTNQLLYVVTFVFALADFMFLYYHITCKIIITVIDAQSTHTCMWWVPN